MTTEIEATYRDFCLWFNKQRAAGRISPAADRASYFIKLGLWALAYNEMPPRSIIGGLAGDVKILEQELRRPSASPTARARVIEEIATGAGRLAH
jgi:hypothetical protein